ncbi:MAG: glutamate--tRNA ligase [Candidatus Doudnabacteria bacterium CG10_big_fil_rev_8_21_14_0_10_41_10]|uniref:Glutamate--tRNA ligase n=1 Tax=Candidatus Doudnabacteria bacterium CG10_big_fil_rev_8_21_14_0_10_41_10 TaxID=1974551 RepID=A0A2H0VE68_9BACT|nr:MAG: glutamate--tRNA ligase [Candidatus Doudnabacteria bacterium CG10_big_fil_rev_8_21_14_0_10_41_10]
MSNKVITRIAPSPTGLFHIGTARTALFNYLYAMKHGGKFILRVEDTDKERSKKEYEEDILNGLKWLGLEWDEFYRQSERGEIYKKYLQQLLSENKAYLDGNAVRFRNPNKKVSFKDIIRGDIEFDTADVGDFVIAKDLDTPLYHFAVVVDDNEMGVTHVIRGEDHISNTPRHVLLYEAFGFALPQYAHLPLILAPDKSKLSKRHGAVSVTDYKEQGYLPEAIVNFIAFIGWNPGDNREIMSLSELVESFSLEKAQKGGAIFNTERLDWYNKEYIRKKATAELGEMLVKYLPEKWAEVAEQRKDYWYKIAELEKERITKLSDIKEGIGYFFETPDYDKKLLLWKKAENLDESKTHLEKIVAFLNSLNSEDFTSRDIKEAIWNYAEEQGRGNVLWPLRVALTGLEKSPDPFLVAGILGKEETISRINNAIKKI